MRGIFVSFLALIAFFYAPLIHAEFVDVDFSIQQQTERGFSVYVLGTDPRLGEGDVTKAVRLSPYQTYPQWKLKVSLPTDQTLRYQYLLRSDDPKRISDPSNAKFLDTPQILTPRRKRSDEIKIKPRFPRPPKITTSFPSSRKQIPGGLVLETINNFPSRILGNTRSIRILLPASYSRTQQKYPAIYMHDGQNLFFSTRGNRSWNIEETIYQLTRANQIPELMIVGIDNTEDRILEYLPPMSKLPSGERGQGNLYARFIVEELIPYMESNYRLISDPKARGLVGSSMGGLFSIYCAWQFPEVFGMVGSLSGSFQFPEIIREVAQRKTWPAKVYLDSGTVGPTYDNLFNTSFLRDVLLERGFILEKNLFQKIGVGDMHEEPAWRKRFPRVLMSFFQEKSN